MGRRFAAQMGAPLTAQSIEIAALEIRHDRQNRAIARQRSPRRCRHRTLRCLPGFGFRAAHADHAARFVLGLGSRRRSAARDGGRRRTAGFAPRGALSRCAQPAIAATLSFASGRSCEAEAPGRRVAREVTAGRVVGRADCWSFPARLAAMRPAAASFPAAGVARKGCRMFGKTNAAREDQARR